MDATDIAPIGGDFDTKRGTARAPAVSSERDEKPAIGVFNAQNMDFAIYQFRQFETASLRYASSADDSDAPGQVGLWERTVDASELALER